MDDRTPQELASLLFAAHPWHGIRPGDDVPERVTAYIEIVPSDTVKFELDKRYGHLRIDRPQRYSSFSPTLYGFVPQTYCGTSVGKRCEERTGKKGPIRGDGDPMDILVITEKQIPHGGFLLVARPIGGLRMVDGDEADDKIIAVLEDDVSYAGLREIAELPAGLVERMQHYFLSYKQMPGGEAKRRVEIAEVYDRAEAHEMIRRSMADYVGTFGAPEDRARQLLEALRAKE